MSSSLPHRDRFSVYIHLPFCLQRCPYCDFASSEKNPIPFEAYRHALAAEFELRRGFFEGRVLHSIYVGGGTPSRWPSRELAPIIALAQSAGAQPREPEITVEANPGDADAAWFRGLVAAGVNRFSVGVQALDDARLRFLGRRHDMRQACFAVEAALESGAVSVSGDLIYGTQGHTAAALAMEVRGLVSLGVHHVSAYELTIAEHTPFGARAAAGTLLLAGEDELIALWTALGQTLAVAGLPRYEISSYARPGHESRHNTAYWQGHPYLGLGAGAHGFLVDSQGALWRYANTPDVADYLAASPIQANSAPCGLGAEGSGELLDAVTHARERVMLGLRTTRGFDLESIAALAGPSQALAFREAARRLIVLGFATQDGQWLVPTERGLLAADSLALEFF